MRVCKGSLSLGTGCRACSKCFQELEERVKLLENQAQYVQRSLIPIGARGFSPTVQPMSELWQEERSVTLNQTPSLIDVIRNFRN